MPIIETEVEIFCGACNAGLCMQSNIRLSRQRSMPQITVDPCSHCLEEAKEEGRQQGVKEMDERIEELESYIQELRTKP